MSVPLRFQCPTCGKRAYWCRYCKVRHCSVCAPHPSRRRKYLAKNHLIQRRNGQTTIMSARRYAHLKGASKGGQTTASRPNPGRFTSETARKAARKAWATRWRAVGRPNYDGPPLRIGRPRKNRPAVSREAVRCQYEAHPINGFWFDRKNQVWWDIFPDPPYCRKISERAVLQRFGLLPTHTKNWVPGQDEPILRTIVGRLPAMKRKRRTQA